MSELLIFVIGALAGWLVAKVMLRFFRYEIFGWIDRMVNRVRRLIGLPPITEHFNTRKPKT